MSPPLLQFVFVIRSVIVNVPYGCPCLLLISSSLGALGRLCHHAICNNTAICNKLVYYKLQCYYKLRGDKAVYQDCGILDKLIEPAHDKTYNKTCVIRLRLACTSTLSITRVRSRLSLFEK